MKDYNRIFQLINYSIIGFFLLKFFIGRLRPKTLKLIVDQGYDEEFFQIVSEIKDLQRSNQELIVDINNQYDGLLSKIEDLEARTSNSQDLRQELELLNNDFYKSFEESKLSAKSIENFINDLFK